MSNELSYNPNTSWFVFDKIYEPLDNLFDANDEVMLGRYVYDKSNTTIYRKEYDENKGFYYNEIFNLSNAQGLNKEEINTFLDQFIVLQEEFFATTINSGTTGDCTWVLYDTGTLIIRGNGAMENYSELGPWKENNITRVIIEDGVTNIGSCAFRNCSKLTSITIPNSVTSIGSSVFYGCTSLTSIIIPNSVTIIDSSAFVDCTSLTNISLSDNIIDIYPSVFSNCTSLTSIIIPDNVRSIAPGAFSNCTSLTSITIGNKIMTISYGVFENCTSIETVNYKGSEADRDKISIGDNNDNFTNINWNYNYTE